jgi:D-alanyl-D-alanine carboxypeptidase
MRLWGAFLFLFMLGVGTFVWREGNLHALIRFNGKAPEAKQTLTDSLQTIAPAEEPMEMPVAVEERRLTSTFLPIHKESAPNLNLTTPHAAVILDADSREVLFKSAADARRQVASLTKILTALIVVERVADLEEAVTIDQEAVYTEGTRVGCPRTGYCDDVRLKVGERVSVRDLLKAALMNSANDAAIALGKHLGTTQAGFATIMNERVRALGLKDSNFCTPSGLEPDGREKECYSTAYDMAVITTEALKHDILWEYMRQEKDIIHSTDGTVAHELFNTSELLGVQPNLIGTKTGFTPLAGRSLLAVAADPSNEHRVVAVVLDDPYRWQTVRSMFDWSFEAFEWK